MDELPGIRRRFKTLLGTAGDFASYMVVRLLVAVIQTLPVDMGDSVCRFLAWLAAGPLGIRRGETEENLGRVFPHVDAGGRERLTRAMWHSLLLMICEIAWARRRLHLTNWTQHMRFRNHREMLGQMLSKRPSVVVSGHFGNFEVGGYTLGLMGVSTTTIARRLDNRFLDQWVQCFRSAKGQHMIDKEGCAAFVEQHLQKGGILTILADQHGGPKGCWTDFMGVPASCHKALALFSLGSNAPMLAVYTRRINGQPMQMETGCLGVVDPASDSAACQSVTTLTQWYNERLEDAVKLGVEQYWWLHRRWRTPPPKIMQRLQKRAEKQKAEKQKAEKQKAEKQKAA